MIENVLIIGVLIAVCVLVDLILLLLVKVLPRYDLTEIKTMRWEAGNPPMKFPKYTLSMQYFGYMYLFMAVEPVVVLLLLFAAYQTVSFMMLLLLSLVLMVPAIYAGYTITLEMAEARS
jgi:NADH:ubiquinone oxidoreductase subunit 3 (subunit A)